MGTMLDIPTRKKLAEISSQVQETARRISRPNITVGEMVHEQKMLGVHESNMQHLIEEVVRGM